MLCADPAAAQARYEVWAIDQSNSFGLLTSLVHAHVQHRPIRVAETSAVPRAPTLKRLTVEAAGVRPSITHT
jgi:hypothetical protein